MMLVLKIPINGILMTFINFYDYRMGTGVQTVITTLNVIKAWIKMFDAPELFKSTIGKFLDRSYILDFSGTPFYKR